MSGHTNWKEIRHKGVLWQLVHVEHGPITTFDTQAAAERELEAVIRDEPCWADLLSVREFRVSGASA